MTNILEKVGEYLSKDKIIFISCFLILSFQICELMQQYLQINLVTSIKFVNNEPESLPAITVCYNELYSYEKISKRFPNSLASKKYENFSTFMDKFYQSNWSLSVNIWREEFNTFHQQYKEITNEIDRIVEHSKSEKYNLYNDVFDNLTLPYTYEEDNVTKYIIQLELSGKVFADEMNAFVLDNQYQTYSTILSPLESIVNNRKKCFTFFNTIQIEYKNVKVITDMIRVIIYYPRKMFPVSEDRQIFISIHSPNEMANLLNVIEIDQAHHAFVKYTRIQVDKNPAYSKCKHYSNFDKYNMNSDCFHNCMVDLLPEVCLNLLDLFMSIEYPIRRKLLRPIYPVYNCSDWFNMGRIYRIMRMHCQQNCIEDCHQEYFNLDTIFTEQLFSEGRTKILNRITLVELTSSNKPSIMITHFPEMSLISFLCNLGGLVGMWLGVSIASTLTDLVDLVKVLRTKLNSIHFINNFIRAPTLILNINCNILRRKRPTVGPA